MSIEFTDIIMPINWAVWAGLVVTIIIIVLRWILVVDRKKMTSTQTGLEILFDLISCIVLIVVLISNISSTKTN